MKRSWRLSWPRTVRPPAVSANVARAPAWMLRNGLRTACDSCGQRAGGADRPSVLDPAAPPSACSPEKRTVMASTHRLLVNSTMENPARCASAAVRVPATRRRGPRGGRRRHAPIDLENGLTLTIRRWKSQMPKGKPRMRS